MTHVEGVWIGLAFCANQGLLYPPIYDGQYFAGTRYMALPILAHAGMARITGDYIMAGKINNLISFIALLTVMFLSMLRLGCSRSFALVLCSCVLLTAPGRLAAFSSRNDGLPVFLQLLALLLGIRPHARSGVMAAGALSSMAVMSKISAVWGGLAIAASLLLKRDTRGLFWFVSAAVIMGTGSLGLFWFLSGGRIAENLLSFAFLGYDRSGNSVLRRLVYGGIQSTTALANSLRLTWLLAPLALSKITQAFGSRRVDRYDLAFFLCGIVTCVQLGSAGVGENHLIDISCIILVSVGSLWSPFALDHAPTTAEGAISRGRQIQPRVATNMWIRPTLVIMLFWGMLTEFIVERPDSLLRSDFRALRGDAENVALEPSRWPDRFRGASLITSEDPALPVVLGHRPVVVDPFLLAHLEHLRPESYREFVDRVRSGEFPLLVLLNDLEKPPSPRWYLSIQFGKGLADTFRSHYRFKERFGRFFIYELSPRPDEGTRP